MKCLICEKKLELLYPPGRNEPPSEMWDGGVVGTMWGGYGSTHDGDGYYIALCDACLEAKLPLLEYRGNENDDGWGSVQ